MSLVNTKEPGGLPGSFVCETARDQLKEQEKLFARGKDTLASPKKQGAWGKRQANSVILLRNLEK